MSIPPPPKLFAPPDRTRASPPEQGPPVLVGFDFDCTLTVRHFFKVFAWGYYSGDMRRHDHCVAFAEWCRNNKMSTRLTSQPSGMWQDNALGMVLEGFVRANGREAFKACIREIFFGGEERIAALASFLAELQTGNFEATGRYNELAIVTAGRSATVLRALWAVPEIAKFFPPPMVWDVSQCRHTIEGVMSTKAIILREISPHAKRIILVDDSLCGDEPDSWILDCAGVEMFRGDLPYEGPGINEANYQQLWDLVVGGGSPATVWPKHEMEDEEGGRLHDDDDDDDEDLDLVDQDAGQGQARAQDAGRAGSLGAADDDDDESDGPPTPKQVRDLLQRQEAKSKAKSKGLARAKHAADSDTKEDEPMEGVDQDGDSGYNELISEDDDEPDDESRPVP